MDVARSRSPRSPLAARCRGLVAGERPNGARDALHRFLVFLWGGIIKIESCKRVGSKVGVALALGLGLQILEPCLPVEPELDTQPQ